MIKIFVRVSQQIREIGMHKNLNILSRSYLMIDKKGPYVHSIMTNKYSIF